MVKESTPKESPRFSLAKKYRERAYVPYSHFQVGAAIETEKAIYGGCNVENASYGATICAERNGILRAVAEEGFSEGNPITIKAVTVVTDTPEGVPPCAMCLQVIAEFATADTLIELANLDGVVSTRRFAELLPLSFTEVPEP